MIKKFNWGWGIALVYTVFVGFMLFMVMLTNKQTVDLVTPDYYAKELKYQDQLNKMNNANALGEPLTCTVDARKVNVQFPQKMNGKKIKADILFYRPSNSSADFTVSCTPDASGNCLIQSDKFETGLYKMQVEWSADGVAYYNEKEININ
ncbi:MAG: FixH family protein [Chitinophagales bacterium]